MFRAASQLQPRVMVLILMEYPLKGAQMNLLAIQQIQKRTMKSLFPQDGQDNRWLVDALDGHGSWTLLRFMTQETKQIEQN
jgi:hypothetical protein